MAGVTRINEHYRPQAGNPTLVRTRVPAGGGIKIRPGKVAGGVAHGLGGIIGAVHLKACVEEGHSYSDCAKEVATGLAVGALIGKGAATLLPAAVLASPAVAVIAGGALIYGGIKAGSRWANAPETAARAAHTALREAVTYDPDRAQQILYQVRNEVVALENLQNSIQTAAQHLALDELTELQRLREEARKGLQSAESAAQSLETAGADCARAQSLGSEVEALAERVDARAQKTGQAIAGARDMAAKCPAVDRPEAISDSYRRGQSLAEENQAALGEIRDKQSQIGEILSRLETLQTRSRGALEAAVRELDGLSQQAEQPYAFLSHQAEGLEAQVDREIPEFQRRRKALLQRINRFHDATGLSRLMDFWDRVAALEVTRAAIVELQSHAGDGYEAYVNIKAAHKEGLRLLGELPSESLCAFDQAAVDGAVERAALAVSRGQSELLKAQGLAEAAAQCGQATHPALETARAALQSCDFAAMRQGLSGLEAAAAGGASLGADQAEVRAALQRELRADDAYRASEGAYFGGDLRAASEHLRTAGTSRCPERQVRIRERQDKVDRLGALIDQVSSTLSGCNPASIEALEAALAKHSHPELGEARIELGQLKTLVFEANSQNQSATNDYWAGKFDRAESRLNAALRTLGERCPAMRGEIETRLGKVRRARTLLGRADAAKSSCDADTIRNAYQALPPGRVPAPLAAARRELPPLETSVREAVGHIEAAKRHKASGKGSRANQELALARTTLNHLPSGATCGHLKSEVAALIDDVGRTQSGSGKEKDKPRTQTAKTTSGQGNAEPKGSKIDPAIETYKAAQKWCEDKFDENSVAYLDGDGKYRCRLSEAGERARGERVCADSYKNGGRLAEIRKDGTYVCRCAKNRYLSKKLKACLTWDQVVTRGKKICDKGRTLARVKTADKFTCCAAGTKWNKTKRKCLSTQVAKKKPPKTTGSRSQSGGGGSSDLRQIAGVWRTQAFKHPGESWKRPQGYWIEVTVDGPTHGRVASHWSGMKNVRKRVTGRWSFDFNSQIFSVNWDDGDRLQYRLESFNSQSAELVKLADGLRVVLVR